jgi:hypothetical protein
MIIGIPARGRRGLPGNLVEQYRAGMIATASPLTGLQPSAELSGLSNKPVFEVFEFRVQASACWYPHLSSEFKLQLVGIRI